MAKEWFQHDYGTRNKKKLAVLIHEEGSKGYGLFWVIVEMLYEARTKKLELEASTYLAIKKESGDQAKDIESFINRCISVYKVFKMVGKSFFTTERVLENEKHRREISKKNSVNGIKSGKSRRMKGTKDERTVQDRSTKLNEREQRRGEESREDERRVENEHCEIEKTDTPVAVVDVPVSPPANDLSKSILFRKPNIPTWEKVFEAFVSAGGTEEMAKQFFDKHEGTGWFVNGSPIVNYVALAQKFIRNWNDNQQKSKPEEKNKPLPGHQPYEIL